MQLCRLHGIYPKDDRKVTLLTSVWKQCDSAEFGTGRSGFKPPFAMRFTGRLRLDGECMMDPSHRLSVRINSARGKNHTVRATPGTEDSANHRILHCIFIYSSDK